MVINNCGKLLFTNKIYAQHFDTRHLSEPKNNWNNVICNIIYNNFVLCIIYSNGNAVKRLVSVNLSNQAIFPFKRPFFSIQIQYL